MKYFIPIILFFLITSCKNANSNSNDNSELFDIAFSEHKNVEYLQDFEKISDTSYVKSGNEPTHRITELKKNDKTLILFSKIQLDTERNEVYSILDTLQVKNLRSDQRITIGYCEVENSLMEEIIAIVERSDKDTIRNIIKAWKANSSTNKIELIENLANITCLNEK